MCRRIFIFLSVYHSIFDRVRSRRCSLLFFSAQLEHVASAKQ